MTDALLPALLPVFAVPGALLLPGGRLPLTAFEPRYLALVDDCLGAGRHFALLQPRDKGEGVVPGLAPVGCLARVVAFAETGDGRYVLTALGVARFDVAGEGDVAASGYRRVHVDYGRFVRDVSGETDLAAGSINRTRLISAVGDYLTSRGLSLDLEKLSEASDADVVTALSMVSPLSPEEKQALLEAATSLDRAELLTAIFEMAVLTNGTETTLH